MTIGNSGTEFINILKNDLYHKETLTLGLMIENTFLYVLNIKSEHEFNLDVNKPASIFQRKLGLHFPTRFGPQLS